jgi:uncharacterized protein YjiS (DUF1127 family)
MNAPVAVVRQSAPALSLSGLMNAFRAWRARQREIAQITRELESMNDRELAELGLSWSDIPAVARGEYPAA